MSATGQYLNKVLAVEVLRVRSTSEDERGELSEAGEHAVRHLEQSARDHVRIIQTAAAVVDAHLHQRVRGGAQDAAEWSQIDQRIAFLTLQFVGDHLDVVVAVRDLRPEADGALR